MPGRPRLDMIGAVDAVERLQDSIRAEARRFPGKPAPTAAQVAMVLHALADHTALQQALRFDPGGPWPEATSVGRWLHAYGDRFEDARNGNAPAAP